MLFGNDRTSLRRFYAESWRKLREGAPLEPLERQVAEVVAAHPEYHALIGAGDDTLDRDFSPEGGQTNPFLHMGMHIAIHEQLAIQRPPGIVEIYRRLAEKFQDTHEAEHRMMDCLGEMIWTAQRNGTAPDENLYLNCLQRLG